MDDPNPNPYTDRGDCTLYMPFVSEAYLSGSIPNTSYSELFVPLLQSDISLLFADVRGLYNQQSAYQGSFGTGLRTMVNDSLILGGYGFYDIRHTEFSNVFHQATAGVELMTYRWEARSNAYLPVSNNSSSVAGPGRAFIQNGAIFLQGASQAAYSGVDAELGGLLYADPQATQELRAFAGGYYFDGVTGSQAVPGVYGRLEARIYDLSFLGPGSRLELAVVPSYDEVNKFQITGLINCRLALGRTDCPGGLSLLERRMLDRIVRRSDIVTTNQSTVAEPATPTINGSRQPNVVFVHPGDDLKTKVQTSPDKSVIIVDGGPQPYVLPTGVTLNPGQAVVGGGTQITVTGNTTGRTAILDVPGMRPVLDRPNSLGPVITAAPKSSIIGVDLTGGSTGILGDHTDNVFISEVNISQTSGDGLQILNVDQFKLYEVTVTQTGGLGVLLQNVNDATINELSISHTAGTALFYNCGNHIHITGLDVDATGATDDAVRFHTQFDAVFKDFDIRNSTHSAIRIESSTHVSFDQIKLNDITGDGIVAYQSGTFDYSHLAMAYIDGSGLVINDTALVSVNHSTFDDVNNVVSYLNTVHYISGSDNVSTGHHTLFTGTTNGGGFIQFTQPNATAP